MTTMPLAVPLLSPRRLRPRKLAMFAAWEDEASLDRFLESSELGQSLHAGWHVRLEFMRRWGSVAEFADGPESVGEQHRDRPVVVVTLARLRGSQLARFAKWGAPVEALVRDHPGVALALAATRPPLTAATFSVWRTLGDALDMVHGRSDGPGSDRHVVAEKARRRNDFHREFTTLRFRPISEYGEWEGRGDIVPSLSP